MSASNSRNAQRAGSGLFEEGGDDCFDSSPGVDDVDHRAREIMSDEYSQSDLELVMFAYAEMPNHGSNSLEIPRVGTAMTVHWVAEEDALVETIIRPPGATAGFETGSILLAGEDYGIEPIEGEYFFGGSVSGEGIDLPDIRRMAFHWERSGPAPVRVYALRRLPIRSTDEFRTGPLISRENARALREAPVWTVWTGEPGSAESTYALYSAASGNPILSFRGELPGLSVSTVAASTTVDFLLKTAGALLSGAKYYFFGPVWWLIAIIGFVIWILYQLGTAVGNLIKVKRAEAEEATSQQRKKELKREAAALEKFQTKLYSHLAELQKLKRQADRADDRGHVQKARNYLKRALEKLKEIRDLIRETGELPEEMRDQTVEKLNEYIEKYEQELEDLIG